jgi:death on curing protein
VRRIELGDYLLIAEIHSGVGAAQLARMPRVIELAEAALAAPFFRFGDYEAFPTAHEKAAVYCARLIAYHPLPNGNKRAAYDVMREFLERNAVPFAHPAGGPMETAETLENLAAGRIGEKRLIAWMLARTGG